MSYKHLKEKCWWYWSLKRQGIRRDLDTFRKMLEINFFLLSAADYDKESMKCFSVEAFYYSCLFGNNLSANFSAPSHRVLKVFLSRTAQRIPYMTSWRVLRLLGIILLIVCWFLVAWTSAVCQNPDRKLALIDVGYTPDGLQFSMCLLDRWDYMMSVGRRYCPLPPLSAVNRLNYASLCVPVWKQGCFVVSLA